MKLIETAFIFGLLSTASLSAHAGDIYETHHEGQTCTTGVGLSSSDLLSDVSSLIDKAIKEECEEARKGSAKLKSIEITELKSCPYGQGLKYKFSATCYSSSN